MGIGLIYMQASLTLYERKAIDFRTQVMMHTSKYYGCKQSQHKEIWQRIVTTQKWINSKGTHGRCW